MLSFATTHTPHLRQVLDVAAAIAVGPAVPPPLPGLTLHRLPHQGHATTSMVTMKTATMAVLTRAPMSSMVVDDDVVEVVQGIVPASITRPATIVIIYGNCVYPEAF